jgi:hypothetical protein
MEDLMYQASEIQEALSRSYGTPEDIDEADLEAGTSCAALIYSIHTNYVCGIPLTLTIA